LLNRQLQFPVARRQSNTDSRAGGTFIRRAESRLDREQEFGDKRVAGFAFFSCGIGNYQIR
jgi:hypothetical protein